MVLDAKNMYLELKVTRFLDLIKSKDQEKIQKSGQNYDVISQNQQEGFPPREYYIHHHHPELHLFSPASSLFVNSGGERDRNQLRGRYGRLNGRFEEPNNFGGFFWDDKGQGTTCSSRVVRNLDLYHVDDPFYIRFNREKVFGGDKVRGMGRSRERERDNRFSACQNGFNNTTTPTMTTTNNRF